MRLKVRPSKLNLARRIYGRRSSGPRPNHTLLPWWGATILWHCAAARTQTLLASLNPPAQTLYAHLYCVRVSKSVRERFR